MSGRPWVGIRFHRDGTISAARWIGEEQQRLVERVTRLPPEWLADVETRSLNRVARHVERPHLRALQNAAPWFERISLLRDAAARVQDFRTVQDCTDVMARNLRSGAAADRLARALRDADTSRDEP